MQVNRPWPGAMTLIEIRRHPGAGKFLNRPALSLCSRRNVRPLTMPKPARAFGRVRFAFGCERKHRTKNEKQIAQLKAENQKLRTKAITVTKASFIPLCHCWVESKEAPAVNRKSEQSQNTLSCKNFLPQKVIGELCLSLSLVPGGTI
jgi:hypothetical protein